MLEWDILNYLKKWRTNLRATRFSHSIKVSIHAIKTFCKIIKYKGVGFYNISLFFQHFNQLSRVEWVIILETFLQVL